MDIKLGAAIDSVKVIVKAKKPSGLLVRTIEMTFAREFDDELAAGLRGDAKVALKSLREGGMDKCELSIGLLNVRATLVGHGGDDVEGRVVVPEMTGTKAVCAAGKEGDEPTVKMTFASLWSEDVWVFLGRFCGAHVELDMVTRQGNLAFDAPARTRAERAAKAAAKKLQDFADENGATVTVTTGKGVKGRA